MKLLQHYFVFNYAGKFRYSGTMLIITLNYMTNNDNLSLSKFIIIDTHILDKLTKKIFPRLSIPNRKT